MKKLIFAVVAVLSAASFAAEVKRPALTPEEKAARRAEGEKRMLERTGGFYERKAAGKVAIVNCQKTFPLSLLEPKIAVFRKIVRLNVETSEDAPITGADLLKRTAKLPAGTAAALFIVDNPEFPMSLQSSEAGWAIVNASKLDEKRFCKQFARGLIMAFGCGISKFKGSPMQPVSVPEDLDKVMSDGIPFEAVPGIMLNLERRGVRPYKKMTYKKACEDGIAPAPTNVYQKAIWDKVHSLPNKPIEIAPETK